jgi:hypothetical protein
MGGKKENLPHPTEEKYSSCSLVLYVFPSSRLLLLRDTKEKLPFALASVYPALSHSPALLIFLSHDCVFNTCHHSREEMCR